MANGAFAMRPRISVAATLRIFLHDLRLIRNCLDAQIERIDRIEREIETVLAGLDAGAISGAGPGSDPVALHLFSRSHSDGSVDYAIDGGKEFSLTPRLAELFQFIASGDKEHDAPDALVSWRTKHEVKSHLESTSRLTISFRNINQMVLRLRRVLETSGYDPMLIQTHRQKGLRLACTPGTRAIPPEAAGGTNA